MPKGFKGFQKGNKLGFITRPGRDYSGKNNPNFGKKHSIESKELIRKARLAMPLTGKSYTAVHNWARRFVPKPEFCVICNKKPPDDLSNTGHTYKRTVADWEWLCHSCHMWKDGRQINLKQYEKKNIHNTSVHRISSS